MDINNIKKEAVKQSLRKEIEARFHRIREACGNLDSTKPIGPQADTRLIQIKEFCAEVHVLNQELYKEHASS